MKVKKKDRLLETALEWVEKKGVHRVNSYDITKSLGISQPSFYYYFPKQEDFYRELITRIILFNHALVEKRLNAVKSPTAMKRLEIYLAGNLKWAQDKPAHVDILIFGFLSCGQNEELRLLTKTALERGEERIYNIIAGGTVEKEFEPQIPAKTAAYLIHKSLVGAIINLHKQKRKTAERKKILADLLILSRQCLGID